MSQGPRVRLVIPTARSRSTSKRNGRSRTSGGFILHLGKDDAVVRKLPCGEENPFLEEDARPLLLRMEQDGEIERFTVATESAAKHHAHA